VYDSIYQRAANSSKFMGYQNYTKLLEIYLMLFKFARAAAVVNDIK